MKTVLNWERSTSVTEVSSFLGLASYFRRFVEAFSKIAGPLQCLMRKRAKFTWDYRCKERVQKLKED